MTPEGPWIKSLLREPLCHFVVVAALIVGAHQLYLRHSRPKIEVASEWLDSLGRDYELRSGRKPDEAERIQLAHDYVEEEILFREAQKAGHDEDPRVRHLLAMTMRETLEPVVADPSEADLEEMRARDPESYRFPAGVTFEHVSFPSTAEAPPDLLDTLRKGGSVPSSPAVRLPNPMPMTWMPQVEKMFGKDFADAISETKRGEWNGPLTSTRGVHFVKIREYTAPRDIPMDEIRTALKTKWITARQKAAVSEKVAEFRKGYRVVLPPGIPAP